MDAAEVHDVDPNWLEKARSQGVYGRLTDILLTLSVVRGVPVDVLSRHFRLNPSSLANYLSEYGASQLRVREELTVLSITSIQPAGVGERYAPLVPLRVFHSVRPRLLSEHFGLSESMMRGYFKKHFVEEKLASRNEQLAANALSEAIELSLLPAGFSN